MAAWTKPRPREAHAWTHKLTMAGALTAALLLLLTLTWALWPSGRLATALLCAVTTTICVHWLAHVLGWRFALDSGAAYADSWFASGQQRRIMRLWSQTVANA